MLLLGGQRSCRGVLQSIANLLLSNDIGDLSCSAEEVKVSPNRTSSGSSSIPTAKGVIVEGILIIVKLVTETIVGILEINSSHVS
jgi:hypothetical protein